MELCAATGEGVKRYFSVFSHPDRNFKTASSFSFACHLTFQPGLHRVRFIIVGGGNSFTLVALFSTVNNKKLPEQYQDPLLDGNFTLPLQHETFWILLVAVLYQIY
jgi:hypothetical protein